MRHGGGGGGGQKTIVRGKPVKPVTFVPGFFVGGTRRTLVLLQRTIQPGRILYFLAHEMVKSPEGTEFKSTMR